MLINSRREQAAYDHQGEWPLGIRADSGGQRRRQQPERRHQRGHHDRTQPQDRAFTNRFGNIDSFAAHFVDVRDIDDGHLHRDAEQRQEADARRDGKRGVGDPECDEAADGPLTTRRRAP